MKKYEYSISELFKNLTRDRTNEKIENTDREMVKALIEKCSSDAFNIFIIKKDGSLSVLTNINDPANFHFEDENIIAFSQLFFVNNGSMFSIQTESDKEIDKIIYILKKAFKTHELGFSVIYGKY